MKNKCLYCGKSNCIPVVALENAEMYGSSRAEVVCVHCQGSLSVWLERVVVVDAIRKGDHVTDDWGAIASKTKDTEKEVL